MIKAPIVVDNFGDTMIFDAVEKAQRYMEPVDVLNNEYVAYDSEGRLLRLVVTSSNQVILCSTEQNPHHAQELRSLLASLFERIGIAQTWIQRASLNTLIAKASEYCID